MKIVGIATRARITDYSLSVQTYCTNSPVDTMAFSLTLYVLIPHYVCCLVYLCMIYV